jgi:hypothetical protein
MSASDRGGRLNLKENVTLLVVDDEEIVLKMTESTISRGW